MSRSPSATRPGVKSTDLFANRQTFGTTLHPGNDGSSTAPTPTRSRSLEDVSLSLDPDLITTGRKLGQGSSAVVYEGEYAGQPVAIKAMALSQDDLPAIRREVELMCKIQHPHCLQMIGYYVSGDKLCIVLERCWKALSQHSVDHKMSTGELIEVALGIAKGMAYLHSQGICHRDLKAPNVLLTRNLEAKVADFGLSREMTKSYMDSLVGTVSHMSPEILSSSRYKSSADVYSFAMLLWQCLARELPYKNYTSPIQVVRDVVELNIRPTIPAGTPQPIVDIMNRCWQTDPEKRPQFHELVVELEALLDQVKRQKNLK